MFDAIRKRKEKLEARAKAIEAGEMSVEDPREARLREQAEREKVEKAAKAAERAAKKKRDTQAALVASLFGDMMAREVEAESATGAAPCDGALCAAAEAGHKRALAALATAASDGPLGASLKAKHADAASLLDAIAREVGA